MRVSARISNIKGANGVMVATDGRPRSLDIPPKATGYGSSLNGGELLFLALATCYCNDIYREAEARGLLVERIEVEVDGEFGQPGDPAHDVTYRATVAAKASEEEILDLMQHTDRVAEIQNSLRVATPVRLTTVRAESLA